MDEEIIIPDAPIVESQDSAEPRVEQFGPVVQIDGFGTYHV